MDLAHLIEIGGVFQRDGWFAQSNAHQNLPGDKEVSSKYFYHQIVKASQVCDATLVMTSKAKPCHVEPCRPAMGYYNLLSA